MRHRKKHPEDSEVVHLDLKVINRCQEIIKEMNTDSILTDSKTNKDEIAVALISNGIGFENAFLFLNSEWSEPVEPSMRRDELAQLLHLANRFAVVFRSESESYNKILDEYPTWVECEIIRVDATEFD